MTSFFEYLVLTSKVEKSFLKYVNSSMNYLRLVRTIHCLMIQYFKLFDQLYSFLCLLMSFHDDDDHAIESRLSLRTADKRRSGIIIEAIYRSVTYKN